MGEREKHVCGLASKSKRENERERTEDEGEEEEPENEEEDVHLWICLESVVDLCHHTARTEQG